MSTDLREVEGDDLDLDLELDLSLLDFFDLFDLPDLRLEDFEECPVGPEVADAEASTLSPRAFSKWGEVGNKGR